MLFEEETRFITLQYFSRKGYCLKDDLIISHQFYTLNRQVYCNKEELLHEFLNKKYAFNKLKIVFLLDAKLYILNSMRFWKSMLPMMISNYCSIASSIPGSLTSLSYQSNSSLGWLIMINWWLIVSSVEKAKFKFLGFNKRVYYFFRKLSFLICFHWLKILKNTKIFLLKVLLRGEERRGHDKNYYFQ